MIPLSPLCRSAITCGGMRLLQSSLRMTPCWPLLSVWRMDPNATVRNKPLATTRMHMPHLSFSGILSAILGPHLHNYSVQYSNVCLYLCFLPLSLAIGRTLIPRYFRSIFEGGATELYYVLKHPKESFHNNFVSLDCDQCTMVTQNGKPMFTQVNVCICTCMCACVCNCFPHMVQKPSLCQIQMTGVYLQGVYPKI